MRVSQTCLLRVCRTNVSVDLLTCAGARARRRCADSESRRRRAAVHHPADHINIAMSAPMQAARRSAVQKKVLGLYRSLLRVVEKKPLENQAKLRSAVRTEFRHRSSLDKKGLWCTRAIYLFEFVAMSCAANVYRIVSCVCCFFCADFFRVDYFVRRAQKYLDFLSHPSCVDMQLFPEAEPPRRARVTIPSHIDDAQHIDAVSAAASKML